MTETLTGQTPQGRKFKIYIFKNYLEWEATNEIGTIGMFIKDDPSGENIDKLYHALTVGISHKQYLAV